jgi:hypothetical protein
MSNAHRAGRLFQKALQACSSEELSLDLNIQEPSKPDPKWGHRGNVVKEETYARTRVRAVASLTLTPTPTSLLHHYRIQT